MKKFLFAVHSWLLDLLFLSFSRKYIMFSVTLIGGLLFSFLSNIFSPWQCEGSVFSDRVPLFYIVFSGIIDILSAAERAFRLEPDQCIIFLAFLGVSISISKWIVSMFSEKNCPKNKIARLLFEIAGDNIIFYTSTMISYLMLPFFSSVMYSADEYGIVFIILIIGASLIFILPSACYTLGMSVSMYFTFTLLYTVENTFGKIVVVTLGIAANILAEKLLTDKMFIIVKQMVINRLPDEIRNSIYIPV